VVLNQLCLFNEFTNLLLQIFAVRLETWWINTLGVLSQQRSSNFLKNWVSQRSRSSLELVMHCYAVATQLLSLCIQIKGDVDRIVYRIYEISIYRLKSKYYHNIKILGSSDQLSKSRAFNFALYIRMRAEMPCTVQAQKWGKIVRLKSYRVQPKKGAKSFVIAAASTAFSFIIFLHVFAALCI
jgi:hypothetical protein